MMRWLIGTIGALLVAAVLVMAAIGEAPGPERQPLMIDAGLRIGDLRKLIRPRPKARSPRVKHSIDRFNLFEPDQRTVA